MAWLTARTRWSAPASTGLYGFGPLSEVIAQVLAVNRALAALGCPWPNAILSLEVFTTAAIPFLRIGPSGCRRLRDGALAGPEWES